VRAPVKVKIYGGFLAFAHFSKNVNMLLCDFAQAEKMPGEFLNGF
jgi:hypothetical protein